MNEYIWHIQVLGLCRWRFEHWTVSLLFFMHREHINLFVCLGVLYDMFDDGAGLLIWKFINLCTAMLDRTCFLTGVEDLRIYVIKFLCLAELRFPLFLFTQIPYQLLHLTQPFMLAWGSLINLCNFASERNLGILCKRIHVRSDC